MGTIRTRAPHRAVLLALLAGVLAGLGVRAVPASLEIGLELEERDGGLAVAAVAPGTDAPRA